MTDNDSGVMLPDPYYANGMCLFLIIINKLAY